MTISAIERGRLPHRETPEMQDDSPMLSDADLVQRVIDGDVNAFEPLMAKHKGYILNVVRKHVPYDVMEDIVQEAFIRAYKSLRTFKGRSTFRSWLSSIAVRTCSDYWRKAYKLREVPLSALTERHRRWLESTISDQSEQTFNQMGSQQEAREILDWALGRLGAQDRMVLELIYLEGLSGKETADLMGLSLANVKVRAHRSRKKLKKMIGEELVVQ
jgi:RNA polymerase sigma-70 factor (ECF subfamily)